MKEGWRLVVGETKVMFQSSNKCTKIYKSGCFSWVGREGRKCTYGEEAEGEEMIEVGW